MLILDEAHKLKREDALLVMTIQHAIKRRITICLTGTPLQNNVVSTRQMQSGGVSVAIFALERSPIHRVSERRRSSC